MERLLLLDGDVRESYALEALLSRRGFGLLRAFSLEEARWLLTRKPKAFLLRGSEEEAAALRRLCPGLPGLLLPEPLEPEALLESLGELLAREPSLLRLGSLCLDQKRRRVSLEGQELPLLREEYLLLLTLLENQGQQLSAAQLGDRIFRRFPADTPGQVASLARSLRKKLPPALWQALGLAF